MTTSEHSVFKIDPRDEAGQMQGQRRGGLDTMVYQARSLR